MTQQIERNEYSEEFQAGAPVVPVVPVLQNDPVIRDVRVVPAAPVAQVVAVSAPGAAVRTSWSSRFAPDAVIAAAVGVVLLLIGLIAITRGGFDGPMSEPVVQVLGFNHTTTLGIIEIVLGAALLIAGATSSRPGARFFGSVLAIGAFVGAVQAESFRESLALESGFAWLMVLAGSVVVASSLLMPRYFTRSTTLRNTPY